MFQTTVSSDLSWSFNDRHSDWWWDFFYQYGMLFVQALEIWLLKENCLKPIAHHCTCDYVCGQIIFKKSLQRWYVAYNDWNLCLKSPDGPVPLRFLKKKKKNISYSNKKISNLTHTFPNLVLDKWHIQTHQSSILTDTIESVR